MRVVVDTNILLSALITKRGAPATLYELWKAKEFALVTSEWQIAEIRRVSRYDHVKNHFQPHEVGHMVNLLRKNAIVLKDLPDVAYSPDPDDNPILAAGIVGQAQCIISGDKSDVLDLGTVQGMPVMTAREFVNLFS